MVRGPHSLDSRLTEIVALLADKVKRRLVLRIVHAQVADITSHIDRILRSTSSPLQDSVCVLLAVYVHIPISKVLSAEGADHVELLELASVAVDEASPLVHLVPGLFVELVLEVVVLLLELLAELPDDIVFELEDLPLLLVVIHQDPALCQLSW